MEDKMENKLIFVDLEAVPLAYGSVILNKE